MSVDAAAMSPVQVGRARLPVARVLDVLVPVAVVLLLTAPALFTNRGFVDDWVNHLWLSWMQSREIRSTGVPSQFLNVYPLGVFYPNFLFYGGTLYAFAGYLMVLTGAPLAVFVGMLVAAFCAAYGGTFWIARQAGVSGLAAHLPPIIVVTGAYYLSIAYGRGSWPELMATSAIPVVIAAALRVVRRGPAAAPLIALGIATIFFSGSHNITLVWGSVFLVVVGLCLLGAWAPAITREQARWAVIAAGVIGFGVMVNGWFLLPDIRYAAGTGVGHVHGLAVSLSDPFQRPSIVFNPLRARAASGPYLRSHFTELPALVIIWITASAGLLWRSRLNRSLLRMFVLLGLLSAVLTVLLLDDGAWSLLPVSLTHIQFTFRLETYIVMALAGLVILALRTLSDQPAKRLRQGLTLTLATISMLYVVLGAWQVWNSDAGFYPGSPAFLRNRESVLRYADITPPTWYVFALPASFRDASAPVVPTHGTIYLDPAKVTGSSTSQEVTIPAGSGDLSSNIAAPTYIVSVHGLAVAGRAADGFLALRRPPDGQHKVRITIQSANSATIRLAPLITLLGVLGLGGTVFAAVLLPRRRRNRSPAQQNRHPEADVLH